MYCLKCGNKMDDNTTFCPVCGANRNETSNPQAQQPTYQQPQQAYQQPQQAYQQPQQAYQQPQQAYQQPQQAYQQPQQAYQQPQQAYQQPQQAYQQPQQAYQQPQQAYQQPQQAYQQPQQAYQQPQQAYQQPQQAYQQPQQAQAPMQQSYLPPMQNNPYSQKPKKNILLPIIIAIVAVLLVVGTVLITLAATGVLGGDSGSSHSDRDKDDDDEDENEDNSDNEDEDENSDNNEEDEDQNDDPHSNNSKPSSETEMIMGAWYGEDITNPLIPEYVFCEYGLHGEGEWYEFEIIEEYDVIVYGDRYSNLSNALKYTVTEDTLYLETGLCLTSGEEFQPDGGTLDLKRCNISSKKNTTQGLWYVTSDGEATVFHITDDTIYGCGDEEGLSYEQDGDIIYCSDYIVECDIKSDQMTWDFYYMDGTYKMYDFTYVYARIE